MKQLLAFAASLLVLTACGTATASNTTEETTEPTVYICTGGSSKRYHKTNKCKGLRNCGGRIIAISKAEAEDMGRTPCQICY